MQYPTKAVAVFVQECSAVICLPYPNLLYLLRASLVIRSSNSLSGQIDEIEYRMQIELTVLLALYDLGLERLWDHATARIHLRIYLVI